MRIVWCKDLFLWSKTSGKLACKTCGYDIITLPYAMKSRLSGFYTLLTHL